MLLTLFQFVSFSFLTAFYDTYNFLSQPVLNFSNLVPDVCCVQSAVVAKEFCCVLFFSCP